MQRDRFQEGIADIATVIYRTNQKMSSGAVEKLEAAGIEFMPREGPDRQQQTPV